MNSARLSARALACVLACAAGALACACAGAQPFDAPPPPGPPRPPHIAVPTEQKLDNGLRVILAERHAVPLASARLVILGGSEFDPPDRSGLASFTAGLLTRGTRHRSAPALAAAAEALGGSLDASASWEASMVGITVTVPKLEAALGLLAEVAIEPVFAQQEIERYREQSLDDMKIAFSQPGTVAGLLAQRALFGAGAYGHPASGTPSSLPRMAREDMVRLHSSLYRPDNAVLVLAGDLVPQQALDLARRAFGRWRAPDAPLARPPAAAAAPWPLGALVVDMPGSGQAGVAMALPAVTAASPDRFVAEVANSVLGMGYSSRLNQEIRIRRGLSYGARSYTDLRSQAGSLGVAVQTKNPSAAEVLALIGEQLDALAAKPVPEPELQARRASLIGGFSRSLETTAGLADQVVSIAVDRLPLDDLVERTGRLEAVKAADVQAFAARAFDKSGRRPVIAGVADEFASQLPAPVLRVPAASLDLDASAPPAAH